MFLLKFPEDIADVMTDKESEQSYLVASDSKRYFEIIIKELPTSEDYIKKIYNSSVSATSSLIEGAADIAKDPAGNARAAAENVGEAATEAFETGSNYIKNSSGIDILSDAGTLVKKTLSLLVPDIKDTAGETIGGIAIPLPNELSESLSHNWEKTESIFSDVASKIADTSLGDITGNKIGSSLGGLSIGKSIAQMSNNLARKPTIDPGYFQDYKGTEPRTFTFSWDFVPRNDKEAIQIREIIAHLKKYTLPSRAIDGLVMNSPHHFDISFGNELFSSLVNLKSLVCTNLEVQYAADGAMQMTRDGMPKHIKMSMTFSERRSLYNDDFIYKDVVK